MGAFLIALAFVSCHKSQHRELSLAYEMAQHNPDSALVLLNGINQNKLSDENLAKYALIYYMAQDKSGLDVDNDSLIRIAYNWYKEHQEDTLYAKSMYYMGKFYLINDSIEQAKKCLEKSYDVSDRDKDMPTKSLALDKLIQVEESLDPNKAVQYARLLVNYNDMMTQASIYNKIAAHLRLCDNLAFVDSLQEARKEGEKALELAIQSKDSMSLSYVYQDLACLFEDLGKKDSCLIYAKQAFNMQKKKNCSCMLALASAYITSDSIKQAFAILQQAKPRSAEDRYSVFYMKSQAAMKMGNYNFTKLYSDSAYKSLEDMYHIALRDKVNYYTANLQKEKARAELKGKVAMQQWIFCLIALLLLFVIFFISYVYHTYKKRAKQRIVLERKKAASKLAHEQELHQQKLRMQEMLHQEDLDHKNVQLSLMRNYIVEKAEIVAKLELAGQKTTKHIALSEEEWRELEVFLDSIEDLFVKRLKQTHPNLSKADLRLMMLLRLKLPQKTLASIYCISEKAIKQKLFLYKEKVGIKNEHYSLRKYIENF